MSNQILQLGYSAILWLLVNDYLPTTIYVKAQPDGPPDDANRVNGLDGSAINAVTVLFIHCVAYVMEKIFVVNAIGNVT